MWRAMCVNAELKEILNDIKLTLDFLCVIIKLNVRNDKSVNRGTLSGGSALRVVKIVINGGSKSYICQMLMNFMR
jgi:hypothetical protein